MGASEKVLPSPPLFLPLGFHKGHVGKFHLPGLRTGPWNHDGTFPHSVCLISLQRRLLEGELAGGGAFLPCCGPCEASTDSREGSQFLPSPESSTKLNARRGGVGGWETQG